MRTRGTVVAFSMMLAAAACGGNPHAAGTTPADEPASAGAGGDARPMPIPDELKPAVEQAQRVGRLMYRLDHGTALASDAVLARGTPDPAIQGWLAAPDGDTGVKVEFLGEVGGEVKSFFEVSVDEATGAAPTVEAFSPARATSVELARAFRARQSAVARGPALLTAAGAELCDAGYNVIVLPGSVRGTDGTLVYLVAATTDPAVHILAGHQRIHVGDDGALTAELMSKGCVMTKPQTGQDVKVEGAYITHQLTPTPLESHVFVSLSHGVPLMVVTGPDRGWMVSGSDIVMMSLGNPAP